MLILVISLPLSTPKNIMVSLKAKKQSSDEVSLQMGANIWMERLRDCGKQQCTVVDTHAVLKQCCHRESVLSSI